MSTLQCVLYLFLLYLYEKQNKNVNDRYWYIKLEMIKLMRFICSFSFLLFFLIELSILCVCFFLRSNLALQCAHLFYSLKYHILLICFIELFNSYRSLYRIRWPHYTWLNIFFFFGFAMAILSSWHIHFMCLLGFRFHLLSRVSIAFC